MNRTEEEILADRLACCKLNRQKRLCQAGDCKDCTVNNMLAYDDLTERERLVVNVKADRLVRSYNKRQCGNKIVAVVIVIAVLFIVGILVCAPTQTIKDFSQYEFPDQTNSYVREYRTRIARTLNKTKVYTVDFNNDKQINCIDYTIAFYKLWCKAYPEHKDNIEVVRNVNPFTRMNHLFIQVRRGPDYPWECIEPQAPEYGPYFMEDYWVEYNPLYNIYGETRKWIK